MRKCEFAFFGGYHQKYSIHILSMHLVFLQLLECLKSVAVKVRSIRINNKSRTIKAGLSAFILLHCYSLGF
jgi:hypothetical protein